MRARRDLRAARDVALLFAAKAAVGAWVLARGFTHVSDDDYARVVIAETFARAPSLDPSGTSWLPLPFWIYGGAMAAAGRTLAVARVAACVLGVLAVAAPYAALRGAGVTRARAIAGVLLAMCLPWSAWTGVAPIPEEPTAALACAAAIACGALVARGRGASPAWLAPFAAACAMGASLSRYEAWPVCAFVALAALAHGARAGGRDAAARRARVVGAASAAGALAGPLAWMAWNLRAHGDALHFVARVTAFRRAVGGGGAPLAEKLASVPATLASSAPEVLALAAVALVALRWREVRARWWLPLACAASVVAFLAYGEARDGAPTHHPARALLGVAWILAAFAADGAGELARRAETWATPPLARAVVSAAIAACGARAAAHWDDYPGRGAEDRTAQIARGLGMRARGATRVKVTPCAYEHFALIAAFGAPERVEIAPVPPGGRAPVSTLCPRVEER